MKKAELLFIPSPGIGHLMPTAELAKLLAHRYDNLSITVLIIKLPFDSMLDPYIQSLAASDHPRLRFISLSPPAPNSQNPPKNFLTALIESHAPQVREAAASITISNSEYELAAFVVGLFCTALIDVAHDFGVPSYVFFASSAGFLGLMLRVQMIHDEKNGDVTELKDSDAELVVSSCVNPVPARVLPSTMLDKNWLPVLLEHARRIRGARGILVNTFTELESHAVSSFLDSGSGTPPLYPVGPLLNLKGGNLNQPEQGSDILTWLDGQPRSSVVFLCFGSMGSFSEDQVKEIAWALEHSGHRFLWSLRQPPPIGKVALPADYANPNEVLPEGFLDRTAGRGKIIGWAPQVLILAHEAIGGFVSHCGWNSTLESIWFGVPIATWPMYSEQQFNAFELVKELRLAVEIKLDYRRDFKSGSTIVVSSEEIEKGIHGVMEVDGEVRKKAMEVCESAKKALIDGGSSLSAVNRWISDICCER